jgi:hypothetical protein
MVEPMSRRSRPRKGSLRAPLKVHAGDEAGEFHKRARLSDAAFKRAMLAARHSGRERFSIGIVDTPSTEHPVFAPHRAVAPIRMTSPAALCAEEGAEGDLQQRDEGA